MREVFLESEGNVVLLETAEEVADRTPGVVGIGVTPKGIPTKLRTCYLCGRRTNNWFGFRKDAWHTSEIYFLCPKCEGGYDEESS